MDHDSPQLLVFEEASSTNALAIEALEDGAATGTTFVADRQTEGRGRRRSGDQRRHWFSPPGTNLYFSVISRPIVALERVASITLAVGARLTGLLRDETGVDIWLKWPNDLYVEDRKLGGILTEGVTGSMGLEGVVIGVGLNVNMEDQQLPPELRELATSLRIESGKSWDRLSLALGLSRAILEACDVFEDRGLAAFAEPLQDYDRLPGRPVRVMEDRNFRRAVARGIGPQGGLRVEFPDGTQREIISGEVRIENLGR